MTTSRLISIALAGAVLAAPAAAQAAPSKPPSHLRLGKASAAKATNPKAKKRKVRARAAWLYDLSVGRPGSVTATTPVHALDITYWYAWGPVTMKQLQNSNGPTVTRSPATTGAQDVVIFYSMQTWNGSQWVERSTARATTRMAAGQATARLAHLTAFPNAPKGYVRVVEFMHWFVAGTNTHLGSTAIVPHYASDHVCTTPIRACAAYPGYLQLG